MEQWQTSSLKNNGRVGVNTYTPSATMHISGTALVEDNAEFQNDVDIDGNVLMSKDATIVKSTEIGENLSVGGEANISADLSVGQNFEVNGTTTLKNSLVLIGTNSNSTGSNEIKLGTDGFIRAREIKVDMKNIPFPDYVFTQHYDLMPLKTLRTFISDNGHLPNMPSATEIKNDGEMPLKEMNLKLIEKVEELTLYILEQEERIVRLENVE